MPILVSLSIAFALSIRQESTKTETFEDVVQRARTMLVDGRIAEGRVEDWMEAARAGLALRPNDPGMAYGLVCGYSRRGEIEPALDWLVKCMDWGYGVAANRMAEMSLDSDLDLVGADPRCQRLFRSAQERLKSLDPPQPNTYIDWIGGHRLSVNLAEFSPDGTRIASASKDGWVRIWDSASGELLALFGGNLNHPGLCRWVDSGRVILTGGTGSTLRFWDARTGELLRVFPGATFPMPGDLSPDGRLVAAPQGDRFRVFDLHSSRGLERQLTAATYGVGFGPDGTRLATASADGATRIFEAWSREPLAKHESPSAVFDVAFSPDGRRLATAGADGHVRWLDSRTLELVREFRAHDAEVNSVAFSPDGGQLLTTSVDRTAKVWNASDDSLLHTLSGHASEVLWASYSPDGNRILTPGDDGTVRVWDARSGELLLTLGGRGGCYGRTVAFSPPGPLASFDGKGVREWDTATGCELTPRGEAPIVRFRNGREGRACTVTRRESTEKIRTPVLELDGASVDVDAVFVSPDQRTVYSVDADDRGRLWSAESGKLSRELEWLSRNPNLTSESSRWISACFRPDGTLLATAQNPDGEAHLYESSTGEKVGSFPGGGKLATTVAFDPSGRILAVAREDSTVDLWNVVGGERLHSLRGHDQWVMQIAFRPDGRALATGSKDGTVRLWSVSGGESLGVLRPPACDNIGSVAYAPDGRRLAVASQDHRILLWDPDGAKLLGTIVPGVAAGDWLAFAPSGHYQGTRDAIARAQLVQGAISYPLSCFAAALESPEQVRASFVGTVVEAPRLPAPPGLVVAEPAERRSTVSERFVHVRALATEPLVGLARIEVAQDGGNVPAEILGKSLSLEDNERLARLDLRLPIPSDANETRITLRAISARGISSRPESFVVRYEPPTRELYLLAFGVADYDDDSLDLACPVRDVDDLIASFADDAGALYHQIHVERRANREVTNAEALRLRDEFLLRAKPEDTIIVFVAGHGVRSGVDEYWFLTSAATPVKPYGGINRATLESLVTFERLHARRRMLLIDTCQSGAAFEGARGERGVSVFRQDEVDAALDRSGGLYILAATSDDSFAREQAGNGVFTRAILDGIAGAADQGSFGDHDGYVGASELMQFARYEVLDKSGGRQRPTFPRIEGGDDFPLARARAPGESGK